MGTLNLKPFASIFENQDIKEVLPYLYLVYKLKISTIKFWVLNFVLVECILTLIEAEFC